MRTPSVWVRGVPTEREVGIRERHLVAVADAVAVEIGRHGQTMTCTRTCDARHVHERKEWQRTAAEVEAQMPPLCAQAGCGRERSASQWHDVGSLTEEMGPMDARRHDGAADLRGLCQQTSEKRACW
jgi:hypothetical protein